ncbi:MAG: hypothetical protein H0X03_06455 [Nitrosopumilus sp.]|nr:hypothetical protein [Nitrosopumilus sp.]
MSFNNIVLLTNTKDTNKSNIHNKNNNKNNNTSKKMFITAVALVVSLTHIKPSYDAYR